MSRGWHAAREVATLIAMSVSEQMSLADVKNRLSEVVDRLEREHGRVVITKHGHPAAVVISVDDLESLEETLDIMDSAALLADIRESLAEDALRLISGQ
jgi:antitoxin YefM